MYIERERKYLVTNEEFLADLRNRHPPSVVVQGYIYATDLHEVRVRLTGEFGEDTAPNGLTATLAIKSRSPGVSREEWETPVPVEMAASLLESTRLRVRKYRYTIPDGWDIDIFKDALEGLVIAEFEFSELDPTHFTHGVPQLAKPWWCAKEVTNDLRYRNLSLAMTQQVPREES